MPEIDGNDGETGPTQIVRGRIAADDPTDGGHHGGIGSFASTACRARLIARSPHVER
jgi:hypothetical protein